MIEKVIFQMMRNIINDESHKCKSNFGENKEQSKLLITQKDDDGSITV